MSSRKAGGNEERLALRRAPSPLDYTIPAADRIRDLKDLGRAGIRYISATEARVVVGAEPLKRSSVGNRRWELAQLVRAFRGRRAA